MSSEPVNLRNRHQNHKKRDIWPFSRPESAIRCMLILDLISYILCASENVIYYFDTTFLQVIIWLVCSFTFFWTFLMFISYEELAEESRLVAKSWPFLLVRGVLMIYSLCLHFYLFGGAKSDYLRSLIAALGAALSSANLWMTIPYNDAVKRLDFEGVVAELNIDLQEVEIFGF